MKIIVSVNVLPNYISLLIVDSLKSVIFIALSQFVTSGFVVGPILGPQEYYIIGGLSHCQSWSSYYRGYQTVYIGHIF